MALFAVRTAQGENNGQSSNDGCEYCGGPYDPKKGNQRFCQDKCRQAAHIEREIRKAAIDLITAAIDHILMERRKERVEQKKGGAVEVSAPTAPERKGPDSREKF